LHGSRSSSTATIAYDHVTLRFHFTLFHLLDCNGTFIQLLIFNAVLLTLRNLIEAVYIWIAGIAGDASANGDIIDDLTICVGPA